VTARPDDESSSARDYTVADAAVPQPRVPPTEASPVPRRPGPPTPHAVPQPRAPRLPPRPRIVDEPGILGLSRLARSRFGTRLFNLFFLLVFVVIVVQMIYAILDKPW
jgi:hypothetical protein